MIHLMRPSRLWKELPAETRLALADAFWREEIDDTEATLQHVEATAAIARRLNFRAKSVQALPIERKARQLAQLPEVPTFGELALFANNDPSWFALVAPARTPAAQVQRLNAAVHKVLALPEVKGRMDQAGLFVNASTPAELAQLITKTVDKMQRTASFARISLDN